MSTDNRDSDEKDKCGWTRRGFMQFMGVGVVGATFSAAALAKPVNPETTEAVLKGAEMTKIHLSINNRIYSVLIEPRWTLLYVLRESIGLSGTKIGCGRGECGACTVLIDDIPRYACMILAVEAEGKQITTLEGLMDGEKLGPVQQAFVEEDAFQCGYCTPGQIMSVEGLLRKQPDPSLEEIRRGVSGNLCRCAAYTHIFKAAKTASGYKNKKG
ncbi:MAG: (2Fe-2S)-binding protein [Desulfobacterales bacterium]